MKNSLLSKKDYYKILDFLSLMKEDEDNFQYHILNLLNQIFKYNYITFNLIDNNLNLFHPTIFNIDNKSKEQYYEYYYKADIFRPKSNLNLFFEKKVITITDIMPMSKYENTEYYYDFIKKDSLYYQLVVPLRIQNKILGGIGVFRQKNEGNFTTQDIAILSELNQFISNSLYSLFEVKKIKKNYQIFNYCINETPVGIIILNKHFSLLNINRAGKNICKEIFNTTSLEDSIKLLKEDLTSKFSPSIELSSSGLTLLYESYTFNISSSVVPSSYCGIEPVYIIFISKNQKLKSNKKLTTKYNLTRRELEVMQLVKKGFNNKQIAQKLYISNHTVKTHIENIFKKLDVNNRTAAIYKMNN